MRQSLFFLSLLFIGGHAFLGPGPIGTRSSALSMAAVELKPEPEGGEELTAISTMAGSRMKKMVRFSKKGMRKYEEMPRSVKRWTLTLPVSNTVFFYIIIFREKLAARKARMGLCTIFGCCAKRKEV